MKIRSILIILIGGLVQIACCGSSAVFADDANLKSNFLRVTDLAPEFQLPDDQGAIWKLIRHLGKRTVVVFFYLGDFMPGCTRQVIVYRDTLRQLEAHGVAVVGISGDSVANHKKFREAHKLTFPLLADVDGEVARAFGVALSGPSSTKVKDAKGKTTTYQRNITASRWTWVIGKDGTVLYKNTNVQPADDARQVLTFLEKAAAEAKR